MAIKGLRPSYAILGHIKAGGRKKITGDRTIPEKWDHFLVTTSQRDDLNYEVDDVLMQKLLRCQHELAVKDATEKIYDEHGNLKSTRLVVPIERLQQENNKLRRIVVFLPFDDPDENLLTKLAVYDGSGVRCRGEGEIAEYIDPTTGKIEKVSCPCQMLRVRLDDSSVEGRPQHPRLTPNPKRGEVCKIHGLLRVMIAEAKILGGVHVFRTTSTNSVKQLMASMAHIQDLTGGRLAYEPLELSIEPKKVKPEDSKSLQTVFVVRLTYRASPIEFLNDVARNSQLRATMRQKIASHEIAALPAPGYEDPDEQVAIAQEYMATDEPDDVIDGEAEFVPNAAERTRDKGTTEPKAEATPQETQKKKAAQKAPQEPRGKTAAPPEDRAMIEKAKAEAEAKAKAKAKAEATAKAEAETAMKPDDQPPHPAEEPPHPADTDPSAEEPNEPELAHVPGETSDNPQDVEPPKTDSSGFPVIVNAEPADADKTKASRDLRKAFITAGHEAGYTDLELREWIKRLWNAESTAVLASWQVTTLINSLTRMQGRRS